MQTFLRVPRKVHNALLIVTALAERHGEGVFVTLADIAAKERVSQGYLEEIAGQLKRSGLIIGKRGAGGGYALAGSPSSVTVGDVITAIEGPQALAVQRTPDAVAGALSARCASWTVWQAVHRKVAETLGGMTLADVAATKTKRPLF